MDPENEGLKVFFLFVRVDCITFLSKLARRLELMAC